MTLEQNIKELRLNMLAGALCTSFCVLSTNYLDTLRIRWQLLPAQTEQNNLVTFARQIIREEGFVRGLWYPGCMAHAGAAIISAGIRIGFYPLARDLISAGQEKQAWHMFTAGFSVGAVGFALANPLFKTKVIVQSHYHRTGQQLPTLKTLLNIYRNDSFAGLFRGSSILMLRGALLNSGNQLGYDYTKTFCKANGLLNDSPILHFVASLSAGFLAVTFCTPADFVLTRFQSSGGKYKRVSHCVLDIYKNNSLGVFFTGWTPLFIRIAPLLLVNMPLYEQVRRLLGLSYLN